MFAFFGDGLTSPLLAFEVLYKAETRGILKKSNEAGLRATAMIPALVSVRWKVMAFLAEKIAGQTS